MSAQIRFNWIIASIDNLTSLLRNSTPQPTTINLITGLNSSLKINFCSIPCSTFSIYLTSDLTNIIFQNPIINGSYTIYVYGTGQIVRKHLGTNIMTNLKGDIRVNGVFSVSVHFDGINYLLNFTNYTL